MLKTAANSLARSFLKINLFSYTYSLQFKYKIRKFWISNISKSNRTILMKIHLHNIYITHKIICKSGADSSSRSREITIWRKDKKNFNLKYLWNLWTNISPSKLKPKAIQNILLQGILKRLSPFNSRNRLTYKIHFPI